MEFEASSVGKPRRVALGGAFIASIVLLFALLAGDAEAELIVPHPAPAPNLIVPHTANAAPAPPPQAPPSAATPADPVPSPGASQPVSAGESQAAQPAETENGDSSSDDAPRLSLWYRLTDLELSIGTFADVSLYLENLRNSVLNTDASVKELIANAQVVQDSIRTLLADMQNPEPQPANPAGADDSSTKGPDGAPETGDQSGDTSSGPDANGTDAGPPDSDSPGSDAGTPDAGTPDAGSPDGGGSGGGGGLPDDDDVPYSAD